MSDCQDQEVQKQQHAAWWNAAAQRLSPVMERIVEESNGFYEILTDEDGKKKCNVVLAGHSTPIFAFEKFQEKDGINEYWAGRTKVCFDMRLGLEPYYKDYKKWSERWDNKDKVSCSLTQKQEDEIALVATQLMQKQQAQDAWSKKTEELGDVLKERQARFIEQLNPWPPEVAILQQCEDGDMQETIQVELDLRFGSDEDFQAFAEAIRPVIDAFPECHFLEGNMYPRRHNKMVVDGKTIYV